MDGPVPLEIAMEPKIMMHVDGDILRRCLEDRRLEELLRIGQKTVKAKEIFQKFCELLQGLLHSEIVEIVEDAETYVKEAYRLLDFYLRPVL
jgi:predicted HAD superfamily phosphohydrolase